MNGDGQTTLLRILSFAPTLKEQHETTTTTYSIFNYGYLATSPNMSIETASFPR